MTKEAMIKEILHKMKEGNIKDTYIMEVCGTHTNAIFRYGIEDLVKPSIHLLSGPGCPVCVTSELYIDTAIELLKNPNVIIATFGDMMKVTGSQENLLMQKEKGSDIYIVSSPLDSIVLASQHKDKEVVFLAVGFETTSPVIALTIKSAIKRGIKNVSFLLGLKRMEPILKYMLEDGNHNIQGIICPGHVAAVKGAEYFRFISERYNIPAVIAGFEDYHLIAALYYLMEQQSAVKKEFRNLYQSCVSKEGNKLAIQLMEEVFINCEEEWRGIGKVKDSGLTLREEYKYFDVTVKFDMKQKEKRIENPCVCSEVLLAKKTPRDCVNYGKTCTPNSPIGPCMVSSEGACAISYKYKRVSN